MHLCYKLGNFAMNFDRNLVAFYHEYRSLIVRPHGESDSVEETPRKSDVVKTNICLRSKALRANICLRSKALRANMLVLEHQISKEQPSDR